jgi:hypothetical protein
MTWQQHKKIEKLQAKRTKKYSLQSLATATQIRRQRTLDRENTINNQAQVNAYESLFQTLTQKNGLREDLPGNGMPMIITNAKKSVDYTPQEKPALETIKDGTDNLK